MNVIGEQLKKERTTTKKTKKKNKNQKKMSRLSKPLIGPVEKRKEIDPVYFLSKLSKTLIGPVEKEDN